MSVSIAGLFVSFATLSLVIVAQSVSIAAMSVSFAALQRCCAMMSVSIAAMFVSFATLSGCGVTRDNENYTNSAKLWDFR